MKSLEVVGRMRHLNLLLQLGKFAKNNLLYHMWRVFTKLFSIKTEKHNLFQNLLTHYNELEFAFYWHPKTKIQRKKLFSLNQPVTEHMQIFH